MFFGQLSYFFGIFSQLSKIACIKSSTKLSSSFFFNLCSFWSPIWSFSEKNLDVSQILDLATLIIILFVLVSFLFRHLQKVRYLYQIRLHVCILFCFLCSFNRTNVFFLYILRFLRYLIFLWFLILFSF